MDVQHVRFCIGGSPRSQVEGATVEVVRHLPFSVNLRMETRIASARPIGRLLLNSAKARVVNFTAASEPTSQCDTSSMRAPA
jgi:hypothetical protein